MATICEICRWCHISRTTFYDAVRRGVIPKKPRGEHDLREVARALIKDGQAAKGGHGDLAAKLRLSEARAALAREQTAALRMKNAITRREYAPLSLIQRRAEILFAAFRERVLSIPGKLAAVCEMRSRAEVELVLRDECCEFLEELSRPILTLDQMDT
jgi:hypothetical protein